MSRLFTILFAIGFVLGTIAAIMACAYGLAAVVEQHGFAGAGRLTNVLVLMLVFVMVLATLLTLAERKWSALMQDRVGPNRARLGLPGLKNRSLGGLPHVVADALKMLFKEDAIPARANKVLFNLGPMLAFAPVFALFAIVPVGPTVKVLGNAVPMVVATPDFGLLYLFAVASLAVYGTSLAGWASNNKFALLGGIRLLHRPASGDDRRPSPLPLEVAGRDGLGASRLGYFPPAGRLSALLRRRFCRDQTSAVRRPRGRIRDHWLLRGVFGHEVRPVYDF